MFNFKRLKFDIKRHYKLFNTVLYYNSVYDKRYKRKALGVVPYLKEYGFWPVIDTGLWSFQSGHNIRETLFARYTYICEPLKKYQNFRDGNSENWRAAGFQNPENFKPASWRTAHYSGYFKNQEIAYANDLILKIIYKKNFESTKRMYLALCKLWERASDLYKTKSILKEFDKARRGLEMKKEKGKEQENNSIIVPELKKQSTGYIRKIVIEELDLLRAGKVSMRRSRIVSSLAARVLESMHMDLESQFLYLKEDARNLKVLPESLNGKMQDE